MNLKKQFCHIDMMPPDDATVVNVDQKTNESLKTAHSYRRNSYQWPLIVSFF